MVRPEALGLCFEMYHAAFAACFVFLSALYRQWWRERTVEEWINEDKARAPLGVFLYPAQDSTLTWAERFPPCPTIQMLPRGTMTSRFGKRDRREEERKKE